ncbi:hypothetical protein OBBRIDRAFT_742025 [Obba rivulosa]|uniref:WW domain-containing protein n=1 Tax=Obba rivulosa TaxID=1052685 RepID=A0A8E2AGR4_9APHY|nr:hypothetical protein OBBRIDRAFT_742025 [Obba rivulosa]
MSSTEADDARPASPASSLPPSPAADNVDNGNEETRTSTEPDTSEAAAEARSPDAQVGGQVEASTSAHASGSLSPSVSTPAAGVAAAGDWQAIWSPAHNAYYFYNAVTQETTWTNPLTVDPSAASSSVSSPSATPAAASSTSSIYDLQAAAAAQGIDPALAHLDPSLAAGPSQPAGFTYAAKFNARTGAFTGPGGRDPSHLSEYERMKRMSEFYFDVNAWQKEVEERKEQEAEEGKKRKRPTKKDLERFKEQKRLKKIAKTAWLRT